LVWLWVVMIPDTEMMCWQIAVRQRVRVFRSFN
jgi:hypothetical protein